MTDEDIRARVKAALSPARYRHTLGVARLARELALRHGADPRKAYRAGLLHDCAKEFSAARLDRIVRRERLAVPGGEFIRARRQFNLFHARVSAHRARTEFGVTDRAVLSAVANHTFGAPGMGRLDAILYVADFAAPDRRHASSREVRSLARRDLAAALRGALRHKMAHVLEQGRALHPATVALWNGLCPGGKAR